MHRVAIRLALSRFGRIVTVGLLFATTFNPSARGERSAMGKGSTSRSAREDAIRGIPFRNLSSEAQKRIAGVVRKPTMFRRMPVSSIRCAPEMHQFVVRHPEVMVSVWQLMGITDVRVKRKAPFLMECDDGMGTVTDLELIYGDRNTHVIFCEGAYDGPLFRRPLKGRCVLVLRSKSTPGVAATSITNVLDVFLQIDHAGVDLFAKTLHPLLGKSADINFTESMRFLEKLNDAARSNDEGMQHMIGRLQDLDAPVRDKFRFVVANTYRKAVEQSVMARGTPNGTTPGVTNVRSSKAPIVIRKR